ncbi:hypothetical protein AVEN_261224-1 [Araneus ventricosus]|uniref:Uncharacterized protein n=1 Tax=Araneus ventricosus TaxID=182803 RepID=A0A4Y2GM21_ARAVE|nr:hypothetical protein AVEN_261224-1 [Araneus ventricosus]
MNGAENLKTGEPKFMRKGGKVASLSQQKARRVLGSFWSSLNGTCLSPDLATSDFHLFLELKNFLGGESFQKKEELRSNVLRRGDRKPSLPI